MKLQPASTAAAGASRFSEKPCPKIESATAKPSVSLWSLYMHTHAHICMQEHLDTNLPYTQVSLRRAPCGERYFYLILDLRKLRHIDRSHSQSTVNPDHLVQRSPRVTKSSYCSTYFSFHFCLENLWERFHHWPLVR